MNRGTMPTDAEAPESSELTDSSRQKKTLSSPYIHRLQRRHFLLYDVLPMLGVGVALARLPSHPVGWIELGLLFTFWLLTGLGITAGYHRLFTHASYQAAPGARALLAILGSAAGQGSVISWAALHRRHHEFSDRPGDPHSPNLHGPGLLGRLRGLAHSHFSWMVKHDYPSIVHYTPDLLRDPVIRRVDRLYSVWILLGLALPAAMGGFLHHTWTGALDGFLWGGAVRMAFLGNIIWSINSLLHSFGPVLFATRERSRNSAALALLSFGESWHNNHHAFPNSPSFGLAWYRLDPGFWFIKLLERLGLAWNLLVPPDEKLQAKRALRTLHADESRLS
jgi:stearoyl-CoA desaturase (delta-9 desaturase)